ncbi:MAG: GNAT family N-acetyltransferase [Candidatus Thorarchaeota archaeon]|nr:MAG: GNAT family N-acetyltransferase [Candidatus Thorarchaeota archaeon]
MVTIRQGVMKDCKDLLEVYQGTRWFHKVRDGGYTTLEQVKEEHRGVAFERWGWLVAEKQGKVIGEIVFRYEKNPTGRVGIIRNLDIDVRNQKTTIGTKLTRAAEDVLRKKKAVRVIATTPPAAYNYWMKVNYFARGSILNISLSSSKIPMKKSAKVKMVNLKDVSKLPKSMRFSHIAYPGSLAELAARVIDNETTGKLLEFYSDSRLMGVGVVVREDAKTAFFVTDVTKLGLDFADVIISRTTSASSRWKVKKVRSIIPKDQLGIFTSFAKWTSEMSTDIPVTRLL